MIICPAPPIVTKYLKSRVTLVSIVADEWFSASLHETYINSSSKDFRVTIWQEVQLCATGLRYSRLKQLPHMRSTARTMQQDANSDSLLQPQSLIGCIYNYMFHRASLQRQ